MIKVHKVTAYQNAGGIERVMITAVREKEILGGMAKSKQFGSIVLNEGTTLKEAEKAFKKDDVIEGVKFGAIKEDGISHWIEAE